MHEQDWIMEQWEKNYYISSIVGAANGSSLVVMSKGCLLVRYLVEFTSYPKRQYSQQSCLWHSPYKQTGRVPFQGISFVHSAVNIFYPNLSSLLC